MNKKKVFLAVLALILVCSLSVAGTLAFLTASQDGNNAVVNTFVAAGGGNIIDPTPTPGPDGPDIPDDIEGIDKGFFLVESQAKYYGKDQLDEDHPTIGYYLNSTDVLTNSYDKAMPNMSIPKNPTLSVDLVNDVEAYIFVKVTDETQGNLTHTVTSDWTQISTSGSETVYVYKNEIIVGADNFELSRVSILTGDTVTVKNAESADDFKDTDSTTEGIQLGELKFEAYACQAAGFASAAAAFSACFGASNP